MVPTRTSNYFGHDRGQSESARCKSGIYNDTPLQLIHHRDYLSFPARTRRPTNASRPSSRYGASVSPAATGDPRPAKWPRAGDVALNGLTRKCATLCINVEYLNRIRKAAVDAQFVRLDAMTAAEDRLPLSTW